ncbi:hypothetical protein IH781_00080 [Patescibacteria group bacterium]|nr:hypothetical protein [Patescibacteria group bacterium]
MSDKKLGKPHGRHSAPPRGEHAAPKDERKSKAPKPSAAPRPVRSPRTIEIVPAILRATWEGIQEDWAKVSKTSDHIQIDITDGVFAGDGTFRELRQFKKLPRSEKIELHMMVHTPDNFVDDIIDLNPARCVWHVESFEGATSIAFVYDAVRSKAQTELGLAINPGSPDNWLTDNVGLIDYALFMGYNPGWAGQPIDPVVYRKIGAFHALYPELPIAVDGHVSKETVEPYVKAGANILCANTAIFGEGDPVENSKQLELLAQSAAAHEEI